jgi:hypothetical protein
VVKWLNLYRGYAPGSGQAVYTVNTNFFPQIAVRSINMTNTSSEGVLVRVWIIPKGFVGGFHQFFIISNWYLPPPNAKTGDAYVAQWTGFEVMNHDDQIWVEASLDNAVAVTINGGGSK